MADITTLEELEELVTAEGIETLGKSFSDCGINAIFQYRFKAGTSTHNGWEVVFNHNYRDSGKAQPVVNHFTGRNITIRMGKKVKFEKAAMLVDEALCDLKTAINPCYQ